MIITISSTTKAVRRWVRLSGRLLARRNGTWPGSRDYRPVASIYTTTRVLSAIPTGTIISFILVKILFYGYVQQTVTAR